jgi:hypothetical protein
MTSALMLSLDFPPEIPACLTGIPKSFDKERCYQAQVGTEDIAVVLVVKKSDGTPGTAASASRSIKVKDLETTEVVDLVKELKNEIIERVALAVAVRKALPGIEVILTSKGL